MFKSLSKIIMLSALFSASALASPQIIIDGEFSENPNDEARFSFLQYETAKTNKTPHIYSESTCEILLELDANRISVAEFEKQQQDLVPEYRDRTFCAFIKTHDDFLSYDVDDAKKWMVSNLDKIRYLNIESSILDNVINAGVERGFDERLCKSMSHFMDVYIKEMKTEKVGAQELYNKECLDF